MKKFRDGGQSGALKRLIQVCGILFLLNSLWGYAFAVSFKFDLGGDGILDDPAEITIAESETLIVDIWLAEWDEGVNLAGVDYYVTYSPESLDVLSVSCNNLKATGGQFDDEYYHADYPEVGTYSFGVVEYGKGVPGPDMMLHQITLKCRDGTKDGFISVSLGDGIVLDEEGNEYKTVDDVQGTIYQTGGSGTTTTLLPNDTTTSTTISSSTTSLSSTTSAASSTVTTSANSTTTTSLRICFIETLYGDDSDEVAHLRSLRDQMVRTFPASQEIVNLYYALSPALVDVIAEDGNFKNKLKNILDDLIQVTEERQVFHEMSYERKKEGRDCNMFFYKERRKQ